MRLCVSISGVLRERRNGTSGSTSIKGENSLSSWVTTTSAEGIRPCYSLGCSDPGDTGSVLGKCVCVCVYVWDLCSENVTVGHNFSRVLSFSLTVSIRQGSMLIFIYLESMLHVVPTDILYRKPDKGEGCCCEYFNIYWQHEYTENINRL